MDRKPYARADEQIRFEPVGSDAPPTPWVAYVTGLAMGATLTFALMWAFWTPPSRWVMGAGSTAATWRLDTQTGILQRCGFNAAGAPVCFTMPAPPAAR